MVTVTPAGVGTRDITLASALIAHGVRNVAQEVSQAGWVMFVFEDTPQTAEVLRAFAETTIVVNLAAYHAALRQVKAAIAMMQPPSRRSA